MTFIVASRGPKQIEGFPGKEIGSFAALEAGESGPEGLEKLLREQAAYDPKRRAWARIEAALDAGQLPHDADLSLVSLLPSGLLSIPLARPAAGYTVPERRKKISPS